MAKEKINFTHRVRHWFTYHPWLKVISFILAVMVWFYVKGEMKQYYY